MKTLKQLFRQPTKTLFGILLITLASAILCTFVGQTVAAVEMQKSMEYTFVTTGLPTVKYQITRTKLDANGVEIWQTWFDETVPEELDRWIRDAAENNPELVKLLSSPGMASAYIEGAVQDNRTNYMDPSPVISPGEEGYGQHLWPIYPDQTTSCAMLEVVIDKIGEPFPWDNWVEYGHESMESGELITVPIAGTVVRAVGLQEGYADPTGRTAHLQMNLPNAETLDQLDLTPGGHYLIYGMDYYDCDWEVRSKISVAVNKGTLLTELDPESLDYYGWYQRDVEEYLGPGGYGQGPSGTYTHERRQIELQDVELEKLYAIQMTIEDRSVMPRFDWVEDAQGGRYVQNWDRYKIGEDGKKTSISQDAYVQRYAMPTIIPLKGTAEEFLATPEGALWKEALDAIRINHSTFPVMAVDRLGYIGSFAKEKAWIEEGRDFTEKELETGAKVCILSERIAALNGLQVGDTISPRFYNRDLSNPYQLFQNGEHGSVNPTPWLYGRTTPWAGETEEYTIVGLYSQKNPWASDLHSVTPNTIFAPKAAVSSDMDFGIQGVFRTLVLESGAIPAFQELVVQAGYDGAFEFYDHGYSEIAGHLHDYSETAGQAMEIGCIIYSAILLLFLLLFPGMQKKNVMIMDSLGADRKQKIRHVMGSSLGVLVPGTLIGALTGALLWQTVTEKLSSETMELAIPIPTLLLTAAAQLLAAAALVFLIALPITKSRGLARRK